MLKVSPESSLGAGQAGELGGRHTRGPWSGLVQTRQLASSSEIFVAEMSLRLLSLPHQAASRPLRAYGYCKHYCS